MAVGLLPPKEIIAVDGIRLSTCSAGIYQSERDDLLLIDLGNNSNCTAVFTKNAFRAAPVIISEQHLSQSSPRYLIINSGNANAGTGQKGIEDAIDICKEIAKQSGYNAEQVLPFSTGVIGEYLPKENICKIIPSLLESLSKENWLNAAHAIMTTDTIAKAVSKTLTINNTEVTITGIAKGAGMIRPDMATMLAFIATDICINKPILNEMLSDAVNNSFNCISVDGDTSTNDACVLIASGAKQDLEITRRGSYEYQLFSEALNDICIELAQKIVRDGEGASKFVIINVINGYNKQECRDIAYSIADSPLVKTAINASDPNWGRFLAAIGKTGIANLDINRINLFLNDVCIVEHGVRHKDYTEEAGQSAMQLDDITVCVDLNRGDARTTVWSCDLSHEYITINAEYRT